jgi:hypothetical protein
LTSLDKQDKLRGEVRQMTKKNKIQMFSEGGSQDQVVHYLSNFAEMVHSMDYAAEKAGVENMSGWIIKDVEIFAAGTWRGIDYSEKDLENMVSHFQTLKADGKLDPVFKINHSEDARDQAGWILDVRKEGELLMADIHVTEWEAYDKIQNKTWKKVSSEIYLPEMAEEEFGIKDHVLRAVAVVSIPKVKSIKGIVLNSERWDDPGQQTKGGGNKVEKFLLMLSELGISDVNNMTDDQKTQLEAKMKEKGVELFAEFAPAPAAAPEQPAAQNIQITAADFVALSEQFTKLDATNKDLAGQVAELTKGTKKAGLEKWFTQLSEQGKVLPAEKEGVMAFAETLEGDALETYKKTFESRPKLVSLGESGADQQQDTDSTDAAYTAYSEQFGQKKY